VYEINRNNQTAQMHERLQSGRPRFGECQFERLIAAFPAKRVVKAGSVGRHSICY
jgi:hypothetical protein